MSPNNYTTRESGFELMRIVAMLMIIAHHLSLHGVLNSGVYDSGDTTNKILTQFYFPGGETGVGLFFMLTGYFLINSNKKRNITKLLLQIAFYGILLALLALYFYRGKEGMTTEALSFATVPISSAKWWFVSYYVLLLLIAPQLNGLLRKLNKKGFLLLLLMLCVFEYLIQWMLATPLLRISMAVFFYSLGAYLRNFELRVSKIILVAVVVASWSFYALAQYFKIPFSFMMGKICVVACCISLFMLFKKMDIHSKAINLVATTTLGIYMIHDNNILRNIIWNDIFKIPSNYASDWYWLLSLSAIISVFVIGMAIDYLRQLLLEQHLLKSAELFKKFTNNYLYKND